MVRSAGSARSGESLVKGKVTIFRYKVLDFDRVEPRISRRWGTRAAIAGLKWAELIEDTGTEVDASVLNTGGLTPLDFDPEN
jgi:hypothetical protein